MPFQIYRTAWGLFGQGAHYPDLPSFVRDTRKRGYDGVEFPVFQMEPFATVWPEVKAALEADGLAYAPLLATWPKPEKFGQPEAHLDELKWQLDMAAEVGASRAVIHFGADSFTLDDAVSSLAAADTETRARGILPCIETHRARITFTPYMTRDVLSALPDLRLTTDLSHWINVLDRMPHDVMELFHLACDRASHLHARIGYEKGPQVPEPADPLWSEHLELHKGWWSYALEQAKSRNETVIFTPEFGPFPYMQTAPYSHKPATDLAGVNDWMRDRLVEWFADELV